MTPQAEGDLLTLSVAIAETRLYLWEFPQLTVIVRVRALIAMHAFALGVKRAEFRLVELVRGSGRRPVGVLVALVVSVCFSLSLVD